VDYSLNDKPRAYFHLHHHTKTLPCRKAEEAKQKGIEWDNADYSYPCLLHDFTQLYTLAF